MDSLSQIALGAAVGYAVLGPTIGKRALLIGAATGTLPDLDVIVPYTDAVESFTYHRSWSHSIFILTLLSWPLAWLLRRVKTMVASDLADSDNTSSVGCIYHLRHTDFLAATAKTCCCRVDLHY